MLSLESCLKPPLDSTITDTTAVWDLSSLPQPVATDFVWSQVSEGGGYVNATWELSNSTRANGETDTVSSQFILPELDEEAIISSLNLKEIRIYCQ